MNYVNIILSITLYALVHTHSSIARSPFRTHDPQTQRLEIQWHHDHPCQKLVLTNPYLEEYPIFDIFDETYFNQHLLPQDALSFRYAPRTFISGIHLSSLIEELVQEILEKRREYTHFTILQNKDFSRRGACGLIVLKFNDYPFVVKLFIETPESFSVPTSKGIEQTFFFYMGGGANRHLTGFTRLRNLELIREKISQHPTWSTLVDTPRKWFWLPKNSRWLAITGHGFGSGEVKTITIPGIYAIIADEIKPARKLSLMKKHDCSVALKLYNFLESSVDPHIKNYMIEEGSGKLVIIDTEYFPALVGFDEVQPFDSYFCWCLHLIKKCSKNMFWLSKPERRQRKTAQRVMVLG